MGIPRIEAELIKPGDFVSYDGELGLVVDYFCHERRTIKFILGQKVRMVKFSSKNLRPIDDAHGFSCFNQRDKEYFVTGYADKFRVIGMIKGNVVAKRSEHPDTYFEYFTLDYFLANATIVPKS